MGLDGGACVMLFPFQNCRVLTVWIIIGTGARSGHFSLFLFFLAKPQSNEPMTFFFKS